MTARDYEMLLPWVRAGLDTAVDLEPDPLLLRKGLVAEVEGGYAITKRAVYEKGVRMGERGYVGARLLTPLESPEGNEGSGE